MAPPAKKRRLLTEHQKDKLKEKSDLPAMYNALDPSTQSQSAFTEDQSLPEG